MNVPLYEHLIEDLTRKLTDRQIGPGQRFPTEAELCRQYQVSSITVKRAMKELSKKGLVVRRPKLGTFAANHVIVPPQAMPTKLRSLVFIASFLNDELTSDLVHGLSLETAEHEVHLIVKSSLNDPARELDLLDTLPQMNIDGAVILPIGTAKNAEAFFALKLHRRLPFVLVDRYFEGLEVPHVVTDDVDAGYQLTKHLLNHGHRRIAYIGEDFSVIPARLRYEGYVRALYEHHVPPDAALLSLVLPYTTPENETRNLTPEIEGYRRLLAQPNRPTAVVAVNNYYAHNLIRTAVEMGLKVPEELSVAGFGGTTSAHQGQPPVTYMKQDFEAMGREAFRSLQLLIESPGQVRHGVIPAILQPGPSTADHTGNTKP